MTFTKKELETLRWMVDQGRMTFPMEEAEEDRCLKILDKIEGMLGSKGAK